ncbi:hypothetical protein ACFYV7_13300 [Nocardia suismassiliense]|uniref:Uncharacterized protein n=1 Tax=Nocardia suismassiliense TaxID=2077092 RepID=A0ABW6QS91_9NOCA
MKPKGSNAYQQFIRERSRAEYEQFMEFVEARQLDIDDEFWSEQDRADFRTESRALLVEWRRKEAEVLAAEDAAEDAEADS